MGEAGVEMLLMTEKGEKARWGKQQGNGECSSAKILFNVCFLGGGEELNH